MNAFFEFVKAHKGAITGGCVGLVIGALIISIGFFSTLFLGICAGIGAFLGSQTKLKRRLMEFLDRILPDIFR